MPNGDVVETVSVALVGDLSQLIEDTEKAIDKTEEAGERAGEVFQEAFLKSAVAAGENVRRIADELGISLQRAAEMLSERGLFQAFTAEEMEGFAQALDMIGADIAETADGLQITEDVVKSFTDVLTSETTPALEEQDELIRQITETWEQYGLVMDEEAKKSLEEIVKMMEEMGEVGEEGIALSEDMLKSIEEEAQARAFIEQQVMKVVVAYREMGLAIPDALARDKIRDHIRALMEHRDAFSNVSQEANEFTDGIIRKGAALRDNQGVLGTVTGLLDSFGINLGGVIGHIAKGTAALAALKIAFDEIRKATQFALEMQKHYDLLSKAVALNTLAGKENTLSYKEWVAIAEEVREITGQPMQKSIEAVADTLREMGASTELSDDQIKALIVTGAQFTEEYGGTLPQSLNQLAAFINTGFSQSLQRLGLDVDKARQNAKAFELGLGTNIDKLSEAEQRLVRYSLLMEELGEKTLGAADDSRTFQDRLDDVAIQSEKASETLGQMFVPIAVMWQEAWANIKEGFTAVVGFIVLGIQKLISNVVAAILALAATVRFILDNIEAQGIDVFQNLGDVFTRAFQEAEEQLMRFQVEQATGGLEEYEDAAQGAAGATTDFGDALAETQKQVEAFVEAARKFDEGMRKIQTRFMDALENITRQFLQRRADLETDLARDLRDIDMDAAEDRLQTIRDYQIDEIRLREDHQRDIHQLEERFILDLEDAVRERDARGVLQLQRRFNLEKKRREEDYLLRQKRLKEDFRFELMEIERQRLMRRQQRWLSFQEELADLALQEERRREEAAIRRARAERDLIESIHARLMRLQEAAEGELAIEQQKLDALVEALIAVYGPEGPWVQWHQEAVKTTQAAAKGISDAQGYITTSVWRTEQAIRAHVQFMQTAARRAQEAWALRLTAQAEAFGAFPTRGFQRGGSFIATGPQMLRVGEGRPEQVDITPLSGATGAPMAGFRGPQAERIGIDLNVDASDLLVVEVADQTMNELADVVVNVSSKNFQGGRGA